MRQFRISVAAAAVALLVPALAAASVARVTGLNVAPDYLKGEDAAMFTYLSEVNGVGNMAYVEAGSKALDYSDHAMGVVLPGLIGGPQAVWSFHLRQLPAALGQASFDQPVGGGGFGAHDPNGNMDGEAFDILYGRPLGHGKLGLRMNRSFVSHDDGDATTTGYSNSGRNVLGFGLGYEFETKGGTPVQLSALLQNRSFELDADNQSDGTLAYQLAARAFRKFGGNAVAVPVVKYHKFDESFLFSGTSYQVRQSGWEAGLAGNWTVGAGDLFVLGANVAREHYDYANGDESGATYAPNVFVALETQLNPWLAFRAGAQNAMFFSRTYKSGAAEQKWNEHVFTFHLGTSVKMGALKFDATLDPAFLQNPFAQLAGGDQASYANYGGIDRAQAGSGGVSFTQVSATYSW